MKYYTQQDLEDACAFMAGWAMGSSRNRKVITGEKVVKEIRERFKPRDIQDLIEYPLKQKK